MIQRWQRGRRAKRPLSVTLTAWGVFLIGIANGWRALGLYRSSDLLLSLGAQPDPRLRLALALIWAALFALLALSIWRRRAAVRRRLAVVLALYLAYELTVNVLLARSDLARQGWPAWALLSAALFLAAVWSLYHRAARTYFADEEEVYGRSQD
jgi:hypothetical protein